MRAQEQKGDIDFNIGISTPGYYSLADVDAFKTRTQKWDDTEPRSYLLSLINDKRKAICGALVRHFGLRRLNSHTKRF